MRLLTTRTFVVLSVAVIVVCGQLSFGPTERESQAKGSEHTEEYPSVERHAIKSSTSKVDSATCESAVCVSDEATCDGGENAPKIISEAEIASDDSLAQSDVDQRLQNLDSSSPKLLDLSELLEMLGELPPLALAPSLDHQISNESPTSSQDIRQRNVELTSGNADTRSLPKSDTVNSSSSSEEKNPLRDSVGASQSKTVRSTPSASPKVDSKSIPKRQATAAVVTESTMKQVDPAEVKFNNTPIVERKSIRHSVENTLSKRAPADTKSTSKKSVIDAIEAKTADSALTDDSIDLTVPQSEHVQNPVMQPGAVASSDAPKAVTSPSKNANSGELSSDDSWHGEIATEAPAEVSDEASDEHLQGLPAESRSDSDDNAGTDETIEITSEDASPNQHSEVRVKLGDLDKEVPSKGAHQSTVDSTTKSRPKVVQVKTLAAEDQEAPKINASQSKEIDSKQAKEEDASALAAKKPQVAAKTFVENSSSPEKPLVVTLDSDESKRKNRVDSCLAYYLANPETVVERSPWAVMHAMLPFGVEGEIMVDRRRVNAIQWMCYNGTCRTQKIFTPVGTTFKPNVGGGVQGHEGQFLAMLAQSQVPVDYPIVVGRKRFSVLDLVRYEMATCKEGSELTFKLIGLSYYVDTDQVWTASNRKRWNIEKLVMEELSQPIVGAACGGTHRLMGLTFALRQRKAEGRKIDGDFARAEKYIADYIDYTWSLQNPDGSFSTDWFEGRGNDPNRERKVQTTGHILEWLIFTLPESDLKDPRVVKSVDFLLTNIWDNRSHKWPIGPRGHATRAVALYQQRMYGSQPGHRHVEMASRIQTLKLQR